MDEKDFKKHLQDLAHGHHHPEEHDWGPAEPGHGGAAPAKEKPAAKRKTTKAKKS